MTLRRTLLLAILFVSAAAHASAQAPPGNQALNDKLWEAARVGDAAAARAALDAGADVNARFRYGQTALFKASERGHTEVVKLLLERGADASVRDTFYGETAMSWAVDKGHMETVRALLAKATEGAGTVLTAGVERGSAELVALALEHRGGLKAETLTAALVAAEDGQKAALVEMLRKAGAAPPLQVEAATLQKYAGSYKSEAGTVIAVSVKDGRLVFTPTNQPPLLLMATDKTTFRPPQFEGLAVTFNVEGDAVPSFNLKRGQNTTLFKKQ